MWFSFTVFYFMCWKNSQHGVKSSCQNLNAFRAARGQGRSGSDASRPGGCVMTLPNEHEADATGEKGQTEDSVAGKRNFQGGDKEAETALEIQGRRRRDKISLGNPANSGLIAGFREISVRTRMRGGAERTRTACQARSRYRTGLSRVIHRGNSAIKCR